MDQVPTIQVESSSLAGGQHDFTCLSHDHALVQNGRSGENGITAVGDGDATLIDHCPQFTVGVGEELIVAR